MPVTVHTGPTPSTSTNRTMRPTSMPSTMTTNASAPESPDAVSSLLRLQLNPEPAGKPPISPPSVLGRSAPRVSPTTAGFDNKTTALPTLTRLPSLTRSTPPPAYAHAANHHRSPGDQYPTQSRHHGVATVLYAQQHHVQHPSPPSQAEAPTPRELAARLALLLHARECCTPFDVERVCGVRNCRVARGVLDHCQECFLAEGECHRSCCEAKQLLRHFRVCSAQNFVRPCTICDLLRTEFAWAMKHVRSVTPLFVAREHPHEMGRPQPHPQPRRHSFQQPPATLSTHPTVSPPSALRRSVSEGPHATMSARGHQKRSSPALPDTEPTPRGATTTKRVRIVAPTDL